MMETARLKEFVPLSSLTEERLVELSALSISLNLAAGAYLFHEGDVDNQTMYLLKGEVRLVSSDGNQETVLSGSQEACYPLGDNQPRQVSAMAVTPVEVLQIDNSVLDYMITWDQMAEMEAQSGQENEQAAQATAESKPDPALARFSRALPFMHIPPANMSLLLDRMEKVEVSEGDTIIQQGDAGDYYYVLDQGKARVTRQIDLAELDEGAGFGEEALIAGTRRNATVTMATDGALLRLSKQDFDALLKEPLLNWISVADANQEIARGARWLDVRLGREFVHHHLPDALNIPLHEIRSRMEELDQDVTYICYCKTGRRSSAAAFLLSQAGYKVNILRGGLQVLPQAQKSRK